MERRQFLKESTMALGGSTLFPTEAFTIINRKSKNDIIVGHNNFTYKVNSCWSQAIKGKTPVNDCHEMVHDSKGRLILLTNETKNNLVFYDKSGRVIKSYGTKYPGAHGLTILNENGEEFLFITDTVRHEVYKTTLNGNVLMTLKYPKETAKYKSKEEYMPTETAIAPNGDIYVIDGYGKQYIIQYNSKGEFIKYFGGAGWLWNELVLGRYPDKINYNNDRNTNESHLNNAHGIALDMRNNTKPILLVTSRMDQVIKRFTLEGKFLSNIEIPGAFVCRPVVHGENIYAAVLRCERPSRDRTGFVTIIDNNNKVVSNPGGTDPIYAYGKLNQLQQEVLPNKPFIHPHDVCIDNDLNLYIPQWNSDRTYPLQLERV